MSNEELFIASEINELEALLAGIPPEGVIERVSLEARLECAREALRRLGADDTGETD